MSERFESANPEKSYTGFRSADFLRAQKGTYEDLEALDSTLDLAELIDAHYRDGNEPLRRVELMRLQRFATLAAHGLPEGQQTHGAYDIYTGSLLALDQGCRLSQTTVYPSNEIQQTAQAILNDIDLPYRTAYDQTLRTEEWGKRLYERATETIYSSDDTDILPLHETLIRLTSDLEPQRAEVVKTGFWLVMRHILASPVLPSITIPDEDAPFNFEQYEAMRGNPDTFTTDFLHAMHPEVAKISGSIDNLFYENINDSCTFLTYKFFHEKTFLVQTDDEITLTAQRQDLEAAMQHILESESTILLNSPLAVSGDFLFRHDSHGTGSILHISEENDKKQLRGDFAGITVRRAHTQKALSAYKESDFTHLPDDFESLMPHVKLTNAFEFDYEEDSMTTVYSEPVEIPLLYNSVSFAKLVELRDDE